MDSNLNTEKEGAGPAIEMPATPQFCSLIEKPSRVFSPEVGANRAAMILVSDRK